MNDAGTTDMGFDESSRSASRAPASGPGVVHAFVEMGELRRMMGRLAAIELLRMMLDANPALPA